MMYIIHWMYYNLFYVLCVFVYELLCQFLYDVNVSSSYKFHPLFLEN